MLAKDPPCCLLSRCISCCIRRQTQEQSRTVCLKHFGTCFFFRDENLSGSDITSKLEPAFLSGLRCTQPLIRAKFFEVFDASMKRRVYERLLYICCSQNWEAMGSHFWIKQCIEVQTYFIEKHMKDEREFSKVIVRDAPIEAFFK